MSYANCYHYRRDFYPVDDDCCYYYRCPAPAATTAASSSYTSTSSRLTRCNSLPSISCATPATPSQPDKYSPVYSVRKHTCYNYRTCRYETSHVTRSLHSTFSHCGDGQVCSSILAAEKTLQVVRSFRREVDRCGYDIFVDVPVETSVKKKNSTRRYKWCAPALKEKYYPGTKTVFCNTGWTSNEFEGTAKKLLFALPHYSYVWSDGKFMIGSTQAAVDTRKRTITLVAPTLMSKKAQTYGAEDIGIRGIRNFFYWNPSSRLVPDFVTPRCTQFYYNPSPTNKAKCDDNR